MKKKIQNYNASSQIRVSGGDRMNRTRQFRSVDLAKGDSVPTLDAGRRKTARNRDHSMEVVKEKRRSRRFSIWRPSIFNPAPAKKPRQFKFTSSSFDDLSHIDKNSKRIRSRFVDFFVLKGASEPRKQRDNDLDIQRNQMVFLAFTASLAVYVLYKLLLAS